MTATGIPHGLALGLVFPAALALTGLCLYLLRRWQVMDIPNLRSSHNRPTPKGGGIGFALVIATVLILASRTAGVYGPALSSLALAALVLLVIGALDDRRALPVTLRLGVQVVAGALFLATLPEAPALFPEQVALPPWAALVLGYLWLIWHTNLYNFMDGIDGLAALQAILAGTALYGLATLTPVPDTAGLLPLLVAGACLGFLPWNFPPARLFMGDSGSAFLGFVLAGLALLQSIGYPAGFALWLILLAGFVGDATCTLLNRLRRGERVHQAHRSHLYQRSVRRWEQRLLQQGHSAERARGGAHRRYLGAFALVFCLWQLPIAILVAIGRLEGLAGVLLVYLPLLAAAQVAGAGRPDRSS